MSCSYSFFTAVSPCKESQIQVTEADDSIMSQELELEVEVEVEVDSIS